MNIRPIQPSHFIMPLEETISALKRDYALIQTVSQEALQQLNHQKPAELIDHVIKLRHDTWVKHFQTQQKFTPQLKLFLESSLKTIELAKQTLAPVEIKSPITPLPEINVHSLQNAYYYNLLEKLAKGKLDVKNPKIVADLEKALIEIPKDAAFKQERPEQVYRWINQSIAHLEQRQLKSRKPAFYQPLIDLFYRFLNFPLILQTEDLLKNSYKLPPKEQTLLQNFLKDKDNRELYESFLLNLRAVREETLARLNKGQMIDNSLILQVENLELFQRFTVSSQDPKFVEFFYYTLLETAVPRNDQVQFDSFFVGILDNQLSKEQFLNVREDQFPYNPAVSARLMTNRAWEGYIRTNRDFYRDVETGKASSTDYEQYLYITRQTADHNHFLWKNKIEQLDEQNRPIFIRGTRQIAFRSERGKERIVEVDLSLESLNISSFEQSKAALVFIHTVEKHVESLHPLLHRSYHSQSFEDIDLLLKHKKVQEALQDPTLEGIDQQALVQIAVNFIYQINLDVQRAIVQG